MATLLFMEKRGFLQIVSNTGEQPLLSSIVKIKPTAKNAIAYFSSLLQPFIESYWVTLYVIKFLPQEVFPVEKVEQKVQMLAEIMFNEGSLLFNESCSREPIGNAITRYTALNMLSRQISDEKSS